MITILDLQRGYWQLLVTHDDLVKTAFCPGPGMGLYQFCCMPFGLISASASFQDSVLQGLQFATK